MYHITNEKKIISFGICPPPHFQTAYKLPYGVTVRYTAETGQRSRIMTLTPGKATY